MSVNETDLAASACVMNGKGRYTLPEREHARKVERIGLYIGRRSAKLLPPGYVDVYAAEIDLEEAEDELLGRLRDRKVIGSLVDKKCRSVLAFPWEKL